MGSARKEDMKLGRAEAAERLRALAAHVERGVIVFGNETFKIPEELRLELEADGDEFEVELKWKQG